MLVHLNPFDPFILETLRDGVNLLKNIHVFSYGIYKKTSVKIGPKNF